MPIRRLNHAVLFVRDAPRAARFYEQVLGFREAFAMSGALFLQAPGSANDRKRIGPLDLEAEIARYGATTPGGP